MQVSQLQWNNNVEALLPPLLELCEMTTDYTDNVRFRFEAKIEKTESCWNWTGRINKDGYGTFWLRDGVLRTAHRAAFELYTHAITEGV
jgi:hypothetical protein